MRNNKLTATLDTSKKAITVSGDESSQRAFFQRCCSRKLTLNILFCIMKMDIMMTTIALASQPTFPVADAFTICFDNAEEGETIFPRIQAVIADLNNYELENPLPCTTMPYSFAQGMLASNDLALQLCKAPAALAPSGIVINSTTASQEKWQVKAKSTSDNMQESIRLD